MSNLFCLHFLLILLREMTGLPKSFFLKKNGINKDQYKGLSQPEKTKIIRTNIYQFKLTKS